nr:hypothetical protein KE13KAR1_00018 [African swine fever virus]CAK8179504.1 hypothetical protein KE13BUS3WSL_00017 [African swine fever virus]CAK8179665.1 hypothetical protein KE13BUS3WLD_KE13BUS3WLD_00018 [African swine fever virus]CAK8180012.1 hypothetical protein KE12BUS5_00017 [African swine fever virus]CAK8180170.1 hypothetical protein KE13SIA4_00017 [African swine fever virus]
MLHILILVVLLNVNYKKLISHKKKYTSTSLIQVS